MSNWIEAQNGFLVNMDRMCDVKLHQGQKNEWRVEVWDEHQDGARVIFSSANKEEAQCYLRAVRTALGAQTHWEILELWPADAEKVHALGEKLLGIASEISPIPPLLKSGCTLGANEGEAFVSARITFETALKALGNMAEQGRKGEFCQRHIEELSRISNIITGWGP